jgi:divalent metal cation (Fe/Co/Zn/Cd) transporter
VALVIWASAVFAGIESVHKLLSNQGTSHVGAGIAAALIGIVGNQLVARYKLRVGRRIQSATLISDAKHSWLDALSSAGALAGLIWPTCAGPGRSRGRCVWRRPFSLRLVTIIGGCGSRSEVAG